MVNARSREGIEAGEAEIDRAHAFIKVCERCHAGRVAAATGEGRVDRI
jgi:hypothetical protein